MESIEERFDSKPSVFRYVAMCWALLLLAALSGRTRWSVVTLKARSEMPRANTDAQSRSKNHPCSLNPSARPSSAIPLITHCGGFTCTSGRYFAADIDR